MKKTLLSMTAVLAMVGSACAVPTVEDRKALCEKHPEKYVWVEKTQACVPINPCVDAVGSVKNSYCLYAQPTLPARSDLFDQIMNRYLEKNLNTNLQSTSILDSSHIGIRTTDGGYYAIRVSAIDDKDEKWCDYAIEYAMFAYHKYPWTDYEKNYDRDPRIIVAKEFSYEDVYIQGDSVECEDIKDFASLLAGKLVYRYMGLPFDDGLKENRCALTCIEPQKKDSFTDWEH